jgi:hypothetical protein
LTSFPPWFTFVLRLNTATQAHATQKRSQTVTQKSFPLSRVFPPVAGFTPLHATIISPHSSSLYFSLSPSLSGSHPFVFSLFLSEENTPTSLVVSPNQPLAKQRKKLKQSRRTTQLKEIDFNFIQPTAFFSYSVSFISFPVVVY